MKKITIQPLTSSNMNAVAELQSAYAAVYPDAAVIPGEVYLSPAFEGGQNVFCALDESGELVAYAPLYPVLIRDASQLPHTLWTEIKAHTTWESQYEIKDQLLDQIRLRAREVTSEFPNHPIRLMFQYFPSEKASIDYVMSRGAQHLESVFTMRRDLLQKIPSNSSVDAVVIRPWRMESQEEQQMYVRVRNECFPEAPIELNEWQYFMQSPQWSVGTTFAAFHAEQVVGNVAVFWDDVQNQQTGQKIGFTEYIFVHPEWRGKNIARELITVGLRHLKDHGLDEAHLEVRAQNEGALRLYVNFGYEVIRESRFYKLSI